MRVTIHRRRAGALAMVLAAALAAASACSGDNGKPNGSGSDQKITLTVDDFGTFGYKDLFKQYEAQHPNIKINERNVPKLDDYTPRLQQWIAAGAGAGDVVAIEEGIMVKFKAQPDKFVDLRQYGAASLQNNFLPWKWQGGMSPDGSKLIGLGTDVGSMALCYRSDLFKKAGLGDTRDAVTKLWPTWDDFIKDANTLNSSGVTVPISVGGGDGWTLTDWFENVYIRTAGVDKYDQLTAHKIPWTDPSVTTALNTLKQIWGDTSLIGSPANALKVSFTASVDNVFKANPTSAIVYEASFVATTITGDKLPAKVGTDAKFFAFPSINGSAPVMEAAGDFAVAFSSSPAVQAFLQYLGGAEAAKLLVSYPGSGFLSANKNLDASAYPDPTSSQLGQQIVSVGNNFRFDMSDQAPASFGGTPNKGEWADLQTFLRNGDVAAAQQQLEKDASAATGWPS